MRLLLSVVFLVAVALFFGSCRPDDEKLSMSPSLRLSFDRDSVIFDTVFVQTGSVTKRLWVYNTDKNAVNIERIELAKASGNQYSLIINGQETNAVNNLRLRGDDSMLVLVKVSINPNNNLQPFLVNDSITFRTNGNLQDVKLVAFGQNAYFHLPGPIDCSTPWDSLKPHVIYGEVYVPPGCTLNIQPGVKVYAHSGSLIGVAGTLMVNGTAEHRVQFRGDRREPRYEDDRHPGQWTGIVFAEGLTTTSKINYADIRNAVVGVYVGSNNSGSQINDVELRHCVIKNMISHGLIAYTSNVLAENCIFTNAGEAAVGTYIGGNYKFNYCTITNYGNLFQHDKPSARFEVRTKLSNGLFEEAPLKLELYNSIVWGTFKDEILFLPGSDTGDMELFVENNIIRTDVFRSQLEFTNQVSQFVSYPEFKQPYFLDFRPDSADSPALNKGEILGSFTNPVMVDVFGKPRPLGGSQPDLGAIEVEDGI